MRRKSNLPWILPCVASALTLAAAQPSGGQIASAPGLLFGDDAPLTLRLEAPFADVKRGSDDPEYSPARLSYVGPDGTTVGVDLRVRVRGKSRRQICSFPPLLLNFRTKELAGTLLEGQDRLKLVTHCEPGDANAQWVHLEYLAYRVLNLLTEASLRARPVEVTYFDTERQRELASHPGILLEDEELFAARHGLHAIADQSLQRTRYDESALVLLETFQYFIGNTDWSALAGPAGSACCHNVVPLARDDGVLVPIAYDFDSSGIVDASYALPDERLRISTVRERRYRGVCQDLTTLRASFAPFLDRRHDIVALYESHPLLTKRSRERALAYIEGFYGLIADPARVERAFRSSCSD
jgi:hypothetical protein